MPPPAAVEEESWLIMSLAEPEVSAVTMDWLCESFSTRFVVLAVRQDSC